jgi:AcrR family transcriptional regulator
MKKKYNPDETKLNILSASFTCFEKYGFKKTNISLISKESNVSIGSIYHHYSNKESLYYELYNMYLEEMLFSIHKNIHTLENPKTFIQKFCTSYLEWVEQNQLKSKFIYWGAISEIDFTENRTSNFDKTPYLNDIASKIMSFSKKNLIENFPINIYEVVIVAPLSEYSRRFLTNPVAYPMNTAIKILPNVVWGTIVKKRIQRSL